MLNIQGRNPTITLTPPALAAVSPEARLTLDNVSIKLIGDPHLGRNFATGCPTSRLGDRARMVLEALEMHLNSPADFIIIMGDLFDKFDVGIDVVYQAYKAIVSASGANPNTTYVILPGNHDVSRDKTRMSSFQVLKAMLDSISNVIVVYKSIQILDLTPNWSAVLDPYVVFDRDNALDLKALANKKLLYLGHWDDVRFVKPNSVLPDENIARACEVMLSGHIHKPHEAKYEGKPIFYIGSMQPYAFDEDETGEFYITATAKDFLEEYNNLADTSVYRNKHIKLKAPSGYVLPVSVDCLSLTYSRPKVSSDAFETLVKSGSGYDFKSVLASRLADSPFSDRASNSILDCVGLDKSEIQLELHQDDFGGFNDT